MKYGKARELIAEARKTFAQRSASLIGRMGGSPEEVRQGITGKRTPAAKSGRALLTKAHKDAERKREKDPYFPYGKAETRRMSKYMSEAQLDELSKGTYGSYIKKATRDIHDRAYDATPIAGDEQHEKIRKRISGIDRAVKALGGQHRGAGIAYTKKVNEAQLDELTDAEMEKLEREHEARMAEQERTAYKSPTMRYHLARLRKLAKPAAKKQTKDKRR